jgi:hypothetical protein
MTANHHLNANEKRNVGQQLHGNALSVFPHGVRDNIAQVVNLPNSQPTTIIMGTGENTIFAHENSPDDILLREGVFPENAPRRFPTDSFVFLFERGGVNFYGTNGENRGFRYFDTDLNGQPQEIDPLIARITNVGRFDQITPSGAMRPVAGTQRLTAGDGNIWLSTGGGVLLQWGNVTATPAGVTVTFRSAFTTIYQAFATAFLAGTPNADVNVSALTATNMVVRSSVNQRVNWLAIGHLAP